MNSNDQLECLDDCPPNLDRVEDRCFKKINTSNSLLEDIDSDGNGSDTDSFSQILSPLVSMFIIIIIFKWIFFYNSCIYVSILKNKYIKILIR